MQEFMLLVRNLRDSKETFSDAEHEEFLNACKTYIQQLEEGGNMISAQPLVRDGVMLSSQKRSFTEAAYATTAEVIVGYYHIRARDLQDAIAIAKGNPEFTYTNTARIEVRPIKMKEDTTAYVYPSA